MAINFRFHRANAECAMLKISDTVTAIKVSDQSKKEFPITYSESVIPIKNPLLNAYYAYSNELENMMSKVKNTNMEISFMGKF